MLLTSNYSFCVFFRILKHSSNVQSVLTTCKPQWYFRVIITVRLLVVRNVTVHTGNTKITNSNSGTVRYLLCCCTQLLVILLSSVYSHYVMCVRCKLESFLPKINFLCWLLFQYPLHPYVSTVTVTLAHKRFLPFCQKCRWQVTLYSKR